MGLMALQVRSASGAHSNRMKHRQREESGLWGSAQVISAWRDTRVQRLRALCYSTYYGGRSHWEGNKRGRQELGDSAKEDTY